MEVAPANRSPNAQTGTLRRRFQLLDAIVLMAATAVACGVTRWIDSLSDGAVSWSALPDIWINYTHQPPSVVNNRMELIDVVLETSLDLVALTLPFFAIWTLALIPLRLRFPRPRWRRLPNQPGAMATCAVGVSLVVALLHFCVVLFVIPAQWHPISVGTNEWVLAYVHLASYPGVAALASWVTLLLGRRWRAERSWIDRCGCVLGAYWVAVTVALPFLVGV
jgi:hypothetical protein